MVMFSKLVGLMHNVETIIFGIEGLGNGLFIDVQNLIYFHIYDFMYNVILL